MMCRKFKGEDGGTSPRPAVTEGSTAWSEVLEGLASTKLGMTAFGLASQNDAIMHAAVARLAPFRSWCSRRAVLFLMELMEAVVFERNSTTSGRLRQSGANPESSACRSS